MITTNALRKSVEDALGWAPDVDERRVGVAAEEGIVTLTGYVPSYADKTAAERATKRVYGVKAVANELEIDLPGDRRRTDTEIAGAAANALKWAVNVPKDKITVTVHNGWVTLEGQVDWQYQRQAAYNAVCYLLGVKGVDNAVTVKPAIKPEKVKEKIQEALVRDARLDAHKITVETQDHKVILHGTVDSWSDREEVEEAAWSAPGVWTVEDHLTVAY
jgi:osmotically-inducible protein OsmY